MNSVSVRYSFNIPVEIALLLSKLTMATLTKLKISEARCMVVYRNQKQLIFKGIATLAGKASFL